MGLQIGVRKEPNLFILMLDSHTGLSSPITGAYPSKRTSILTLISEVAVNKFYNQNEILASCNILTDPRKGIGR